MTARTTTQLVVDTTGFMSFSPDDVQSSGSNHLLPFFIALLFEFFQSLCVFRRSFISSNFLRHDLWVTTQFNISSTTGHICCNRDRTFTARLGHNVGFAFVMFSIQDFMFDAFFFKPRAQKFRFFNADSSHKYWLSTFDPCFHVLGNGFKFSSFSFINHIVVILTRNGTICWNHCHIKIIDFFKLYGFSICSSSHARKFFVHSEIILESDRR